jgi:hypothetical protein
MAQGRKTRRGKEKPEDEGPMMVDLNSGILYVHEALHMTDYFVRSIDDALAQHPAVKSRREWRALCEKAGAALGELYQLIGSESYYLQSPENRPAADPYRGFRTAVNKTFDIEQALRFELAEEPEIKRMPEWAAVVAQAEAALEALRGSVEAALKEARKRG